jgi:hypothetical protein
MTMGTLPETGLQFSGAIQGREITNQDDRDFCPPPAVPLQE